MPQISCSAHTCVHNCDSKCSLQDVKVGGASAKKSGDTACNSFREKTEGFNNAVSHGCICSDSNVKCAAKKCIFNMDGGCEADHIDVDGIGADTKSDTSCRTFKK